jgi:hypothetical protein
VGGGTGLGGEREGWCGYVGAGAGVVYVLCLRAGKRW